MSGGQQQQAAFAVGGDGVPTCSLCSDRISLSKEDWAQIPSGWVISFTCDWCNAKAQANGRGFLEYVAQLNNGGPPILPSQK